MLRSARYVRWTLASLLMFFFLHSLDVNSALVDVLIFAILFNLLIVGILISRSGVRH